MEGDVEADVLAGVRALKEALRVLQQEMAELHRTFQAAYPGGKVGGASAAPGGTPRGTNSTANAAAFVFAHGAPGAPAHVALAFSGADRHGMFRSVARAQLVQLSRTKHRLFARRCGIQLGRHERAGLQLHARHVCALAFSSKLLRKDTSNHGSMSINHSSRIANCVTMIRYL